MVTIRRTLACLILFSMLLGGTSFGQSPEQDTGVEGVEIHSQPSELAGHWAEPLFTWAITKNIIDGYPDGTKKADKLVNEAEFLKMLYRAFGMALPIPYYAPDDYDWTGGPYRLASMWKHPTLGSTNSEMRLAPITRGRAAEIITAAQGVHYEGKDAVLYLVGHGMTNISIKTLDDFKENDTFTRAEAIQWIRQLILRGMFKIQERPIELSDSSLLPVLTGEPIEPLPDFSVKSVTAEDFNLFQMNANPVLKLGDSKASIEAVFGVSDEMSGFNMNMYPNFSVRYNEHDLLDAWNVEIDQYAPPAEAHPSFTTNKGITLGKSTLFDVMQQYGTVGYKGGRLATYYYEKTPDGGYRSLDAMSSYYQIEKRKNLYMISFIFDETALKVDYMRASVLPLAKGD